MSDECCNNGRVVGEQAYNSRDKPTTIHRREFLSEPIKDDEIEGKEHPIDFLDKADITPDELLDLIHIEGSEELQTKLKSLCREYRDIFSTTVRGKPANLPEMKIEVDETKWEHGRNRLPPRQHGPEKQAEIIKQIKLLLDLDIIEISVTNEWSQVHMVPKLTSPNEWRSNIDFVKINEYTIGLEG
jgi:hypothetical protein